MKKTESTATETTVMHYNRPEIKATIQRMAADGANHKCGNGDFHSWYRMKTKNKHLCHLDLTNDADYKYLINRFRSLYWSLNYFDETMFKMDYNQKLDESIRIKKQDSAKISREHTTGYTFGVDIDKGHGCDIHTEDIKQAVEDMAQFYCDELRQYAPNSVYAAYSGGGVHIYVHHKVFEPYFKQEGITDYDHAVRVLHEVFALLIEDIRIKFFDKFPQHEDKVKPDSLNNAKRVFKSLFSIHKSLPYAVIPLDPKNISINFNDAKLPLSDEVVSRADDWYIIYDNDLDMLRQLGKFYKVAEQNIKADRTFSYTKSLTLIDSSLYPPCIKNILKMDSCGEGATRALALLAAFLGQVGLSYDDASIVWYGLANHWDAAAAHSNVFESNFQKMHTTSCKKLADKNNKGYPGTSIHIIGACKPVMRCMDIGSPYYFADKKANSDRLKNRLITRAERSNKAAK